MKRYIFLMLLCFPIFASAVSFNPPSQPIAFIVALDVTNSLNAEKFVTLRDRTMVDLVLSRVRIGDTIHFLPLSENSGENPMVFTASGQRLLLGKNLASWFQTNIHIQEIRKTKATDVAGVLDYALRVAQSESLMHTPRRVQVVILTDGHVEGHQTPLSAQCSANLRIDYFGVETQFENSLKDWTTSVCSQAMFGITRFANWETAKNVYVEKLDRPDNGISHQFLSR